MTERNRLTNGRFRHNIDGWTSSGAAYSAGDGDAHYGVVVLNTGGDYIEQEFSVPQGRGYTLHLSVKSVGADLSGSQAQAQLTDDNGDTVVDQNLSGTADTWIENTVDLGLVPGGTYTLKIINNSASGDVKIDDVWLWWVPMTRAAMALVTHAKLARLASERSLSTAVDGALSEGDYTYAVDAGLRGVGAINPETDLPDTRYLDTSDLDTCLDAIELEMLKLLQRDYAVEVDLSVGPRREALSQKSKMIGDLTGSSRETAGRVVSRILTHRGAV